MVFRVQYVCCVWAELSIFNEARRYDRKGCLFLQSRQLAVGNTSLCCGPRVNLALSMEQYAECAVRKIGLSGLKDHVDYSLLIESELDQVWF